MPEEAAGQESGAIRNFRVDISEIASLIKVSDEIGADIAEGRRLLLIAINMGKTSKDFKIIAKYLGDSRRMMEAAIEAAISRLAQGLQGGIAQLMGLGPDEQTEAHEMQGQLEPLREWVAQKKYADAAATIKAVSQALSARGISHGPAPGAPSAASSGQGSAIAAGAQAATQGAPASPAPSPQETPGPRAAAHPIVSEMPPASLNMGEVVPGNKPAAAPPAPAYKIEKLSETAKCALCYGKVKPGFTVLSCRCGQVYHEACGKRANKCSVCGAEYGFDTGDDD